MDDLDRLFRYLVNHLAKDAPERLTSPFEVSELYQSIVPYRGHRRALKFESVEDYEMAVLRLLSGERGYASVEPLNVQEALALEAESVNPDPGAFRDFAAASVKLSARGIRSVLDEEVAYAPPGHAPRAENRFAPPKPEVETAEELFAPPEPQAPAEQTARPAQPEAVDPRVGRGLVFETVEATCPHCYVELPGRRRVVYCPSCGRQVEEATCPACGDGLEPGWRFCVTCGHSVSG